MNLHAFATPAILGLCALSLLTSPLSANENDPLALDLSQLRFHPTPLPEPDDPAPATPAVPYAAPASYTPALPSDLDTDSLARYQQRITELQDHGGLYAPGLSEAHEALGRLQLQQGNLEAALTAFQAAQHVTRASQGLYSPGQVPLLREMIAANLALGRIPEAHSLQEALLSLQLRQQDHDDLAAVPALLEWADWNVRLYLSQGPAIFNEIDFSGAAMSSNNPLLQTAYERYIDALEILRAKETQADDSRLVDVERKLAALNFIVSRDSYRALPNAPMTMQAISSPPQSDESALERANTFHFLNGRSALERAIAYGYIGKQPDYDIIAARLMELGDWYLLFDRRASALETYQEALTLLNEAQVPPQEAERIVASTLPVRTPDASYFDTRTGAYAGYIDVEFDLNRYGMASNAQILDSSAADSRIERELLRTIRAGRFRPKFTNGEAVGEDHVQLRYYYAIAGA
jgi:hypothetical protein